MLLTSTSNVAEWIVGAFPNDSLSQLWFGITAFAVAFLAQAVWRDKVIDDVRRPAVPLLYRSFRQSRLCNPQPRFYRGSSANHEGANRARILPAGVNIPDRRSRHPSAEG